MTRLRTSHNSQTTIGETESFDVAVKRDYVRFQLCIWGFFLVLNVISLIWETSPPGHRPYIAILKVYETILMGICSHVIWLVAQRYRWLKDVKLARWRSVGACFVAATFVVGAAFPFVLIFSGANQSHSYYSLPLIMLGNWIGVAVGLAIWGGLYRAYYYQARNRHLETERVRLLAATQQAQLMALKGQINPHFLFNSLNTLRALIQREPATARDAVTHLADIMRYSLTMADHPSVPLAIELELVNDYLALETLRHEDRLRIQKNIQPEALRESVPPMLLQTLIENAVKHGLRQCSEGIVVECSISIKSGGYGLAGTYLHISVTNQGYLESGADALDAFSSRSLPQPANTSGTGLRNARERLRLLYGSRASLTVTQHGRIVVAEVMIPLATITETIGTQNSQVL